MIKRYTDAEMKSELSKLTVLCDTREKDTHCEDYFKSHNIPHVRRKLNTGDYSAQLGDISLEYDICIERKRSLDEICGNFTAERERFEREFLRAKAYGTKVYLIVENATWTDVFLGNYRSKLSAKSLFGSLLSWMARFNITVLFCKPDETPRLIYGIIYYFVKERLTYGDKR